MTPAVESPTIVIFAKAPEPGRVKTRLCPPLTPAAAAELHAACLSDLWERLARLPTVRRVLCHDPPELRETFRRLLCGDPELLAQDGGDLGGRLGAAFQCLFARGLGPIVAIGADSPDLPLAHIEEAIQSLTSGASDVVLGPALDGGYTLVGLREFRPEPFSGIPWSTPEVCSTTCIRCADAGLRLHLLPPWEDVDDGPALVRLQERVLSRPTGLPHLRRLFSEWAVQDRAVACHTAIRTSEP